MIGKKRLALAAGSVTAAGAVATLVAGTTFGLFSSQNVGSPSTFTAGTVSLSQDASVTCTLSNIQPGDSTAGWAAVNTGAAGNGTTGSQCQLPYTYTAPNESSAWLAVDITFAQTKGPDPEPTPYGGSSAPAAANLIDGSNAGLQLLLQDGSTSVINGFQYKQDNAGNTLANLPATGVNDLLLNTGSNATTSQSGTLKLDWSMPSSSGNAYQGASTVVTMTVHAVQSRNNPKDSNCVAYSSCTVANAPAWS